jgi:hypothetical protein
VDLRVEAVKVGEREAADGVDDALAGLLVYQRLSAGLETRAAHIALLDGPPLCAARRRVGARAGLLRAEDADGFAGEHVRAAGVEVVGADKVGELERVWVDGQHRIAGLGGRARARRINRSASLSHGRSSGTHLARLDQVRPRAAVGGRERAGLHVGRGLAAAAAAIVVAVPLGEPAVGARRWPRGERDRRRREGEREGAHVEVKRVWCERWTSIAAAGTGAVLPRTRLGFE